MLKRIFLHVVSMAAVTAFGPASPRLAYATEPTTYRVAMLVNRLGSDDYRQREEAHRELEILGPAARPQLDSAAEHDDPEISLRAARILRELEHDAAWSGTPVVLPSDHPRAREVAAALTAQTGMQLATHELIERAGDPPVIIDRSEMQFWPAVECLASRLDGTICWRFGTCGKSTLVAVSRRDRWAATSNGSLRCEVFAIRPRCRERRKERSATESEWRILLRLSWETKLHVVAVHAAPRLSLAGGASSGMQTRQPAAEQDPDEWIYPAPGLPCTTLAIPVSRVATREQLRNVHRIEIEWDVVAVDFEGQQDRRCIRFELAAADELVP